MKMPPTGGRKRIKAPPKRLLLSDENRLADVLGAVDGLCPQTGLVFRHYGVKDRDDLARLVANAIRAKGLWLAVAGDGKLAARLATNGVHLPQYLGVGILRTHLKNLQKGHFVTMACHDRAGLVRAGALGLDGVILSPVLATKSHPGARYLGLIRARAMTRGTKIPVWWMGGLTPKQFEKLASGAYGIAGIGGLAPKTSK